MKIKIDGKELPELSSVPIGELCEAEQALGLDMETTGLAGRTALMVFVGMRREDPAKPAASLATEVMTADFLTLEQVEDERPPALASVNGGGSADAEPPARTDLESSGVQPSERSA